MVLEQLWWALGLPQGLAWSVVLHIKGCVLLTTAVAALLQELVLELLRGAGDLKHHLALGHSRKNITVK